MAADTAAGAAKTAPAAPRSRKSVTGTRKAVAALFLLPALVLLGANTTQMTLFFSAVRMPSSVNSA